MNKNKGEKTKKNNHTLSLYLALKFRVINKFHKTRTASTIHTGNIQEFLKLVHEVTLEVLKAEHL